ncbi:cyclic AMP-dependent transcription factor ATF-4-like [Eulemur rufifrons]|uniref:cyclic AMP-dependent transcription factor ATF-4-like n=1 Tax=Eulemur rufifrons TaxID=859984 RepID=UPI0037434D71
MDEELIFFILKAKLPSAELFRFCQFIRSSAVFESSCFSALWSRANLLIVSGALFRAAVPNSQAADDTSVRPVRHGPHSRRRGETSEQSPTCSHSAPTAEPCASSDCGIRPSQERDPRCKLHTAGSRLGAPRENPTPDDLRWSRGGYADPSPALGKTVFRETPSKKGEEGKDSRSAPFTFLQPLPLFPGVLSSTPDHSFSLELGSEVDISEGDRKSDSSAYITLIPQCVKEEDTPSDNDSGVCMSPESYLGSPQHSPSTASGSPNSLPSPGVLCGSARPKPYNRPGEKMAVGKVKGEKLDKKLKKMEQNKTEATRYRQKKRAEQEALAGECKELEKKNESLKEKADALAKEIQYLKDLIEEVRKARGKKESPS